MMSERHTGEARRSFPVYQYNLPSIPIIYIPNPFYQMTVQRASRTEHPKQGMICWTSFVSIVYFRSKSFFIFQHSVAPLRLYIFDW